MWNTLQMYTPKFGVRFLLTSIGDQKVKVVSVLLFERKVQLKFPITFYLSKSFERNIILKNLSLNKRLPFLSFAFRYDFWNEKFLFHFFPKLSNFHFKR